jgi:hypothetical protein
MAQLACLPAGRPAGRQERGEEEPGGKRQEAGGGISNDERGRAENSFLQPLNFHPFFILAFMFIFRGWYVYP